MKTVNITYTAYFDIDIEVPDDWAELGQREQRQIVYAQQDNFTFPKKPNWEMTQWSGLSGGMDDDEMDDYGDLD